MANTHLGFLRSLLLGALVLGLLPTAAGAVQHEVRILMDLDDDPGTGCLVNTVEGPFDGVEQVLISTVETTSPPDAGTVTDVATIECTDPDADTFSAPSSFDGNWPVGIGNGVGGRDVVETYVPLLALVIQGPSIVHLAVVVTDEQGGEEALLTADGTPDGEPILLDLRSLLEIPTLGEWGLILLALLLAASSLALLGRRGTPAVGVALLVLAAGTAWAAGTLDGLTGDWTAGDQLAANGLVLFGKEAGDDLCFRVDVDLLFNQPPTAQPDASTTDEDTPVLITLTGSDADGDSLAFAIVAGPSNGTLGPVTSTGPTTAEVTYTPNGDFAGSDEFTYRASDGTADSNTAVVSITVNQVFDDSQTFTFTGGQQDWTVPDGVTTIAIDAFGAQGGRGGGPTPSAGGLGGRVAATITVTPGESLAILVGGAGGDAGDVGGTCAGGAGAAGFNGGAAGGDHGCASGGGGGASDVRSGGTDLGDRVVVAGGGGGGGGFSGVVGGAGGAGGDQTGAAGGSPSAAGGGGGGTQSAGGAGGAGADDVNNGTAGASGDGGAGGSSASSGGGGGGGYFGGGGGGAGLVGDEHPGGGGGGGSSFVDPAVVIGTPTHTQGNRTGNGQVVITW